MFTPDVNDCMQCLSVVIFDFLFCSWIDSILNLPHMRQIVSVSVKGGGGEKTLIAEDQSICWNHVNKTLIRTAAWSL